MDPPICDVKGQNVRLVDVFLLGPFMMWFGATAKDMPDWARTLMVVSGAGTIVFNGVNWYRLNHVR